MPENNNHIMNRDGISLEEMLDRLAAEAQVRRLAQRDGADLPLWCRRRAEVARNRRHYLAFACIMLLLVSCSYQLAPTRNYLVADGVSYEEVATLNNHMLGK